MKNRSTRYSARSKYINGLEKKIQQLITKNDTLRRENERMAQELRSYADIKDQIKDLEAQYLNGIQDAMKFIDECKKMIASGKTAQAKYTRQMRGLFKTIK